MAKLPWEKRFQRTIRRSELATWSRNYPQTYLSERQKVVFTRSTVGKRMLTGMFTRYALHTGRGWTGWTGELLIAEWEELEKNVAPEFHVTRVTSQEIQVSDMKGDFMFPCADGSMIQEGHVVLVLHAFNNFSKKIRMREEAVPQKFLLPATPQAAEGEATDEKRDSWSISSECICRHHIAPRGELFVSSEPSFPILTKCSDVVRQTKFGREHHGRLLER